MRELVAITKALADESRVRALMFLCSGELCVCQIIEMLGLAPSTVSKHMAVLHQAGLVETRKDGRWIYYRLPADDAPAAVPGAIRWVRAALRDDPRVREDVRRLAGVRRMSKEKLCAHYRK
jgi:DNA-binding transcriptional ArsR family regulator